MVAKKFESVLPDNKLLAAIDIGSNSFHLIIARMVMGALQPVQRRKEQIQLAAGLDEELELSGAAIKRGVDCLVDMGQLLRETNPDQVRIVATHTIRAARNRDMFLSLAEQAAGYPIEVISGREEARLIFQGVAHTKSLDGKTLVLDIGGGSTELACGEGFDPSYRVSRTMGCVSFSQAFFAKAVTAKTFNAAYLTAMQHMENVVHGLAGYRWQQVFATSGTAKILAKAALLVCDSEGLERTVLYALRDHLLSTGDVSELETLGISESRCRLLPGGLAIMLAIMDSLDIDSMRYCDTALREGMLYEMEGQMRHDDIRLRTRQSLQARYLVDSQYAQHVADTCDYLRTQVEGAWELTDPLLAQLLREAAHLHEVGMQISSSHVQGHSAYILANSDMPGYNQEQQLILSLIVSCFRKRLKPDQLPVLRSLSQKKLLRLIRLLRLGVLLNNLRISFVLEKLLLTASGRRLVLKIDACELTQSALMQADFDREAEYMRRVGFEFVVHTD